MREFIVDGYEDCHIAVIFHDGVVLIPMEKSSFDNPMFRDLVKNSVGEQLVEEIFNNLDGYDDLWQVAEDLKTAFSIKVVFLDEI